MNKTDIIGCHFSMMNGIIEGISMRIFYLLLSEELRHFPFYVFNDLNFQFSEKYFLNSVYNVYFSPSKHNVRD